MATENPVACRAWTARFDWQFRSNPWREDKTFGNAVIDGDQVVGYHFVNAQPIRVTEGTGRGLFGMNLYLDPAFRSSLVGLMLFKLFFSIANYDYYLTTTANPVTERIFRLLGAKGSLDGSHSWIKVLRPFTIVPAVLERAVTRGEKQSRAEARTWTPARNGPLEPAPAWESEEVMDAYEEISEFWMKIHSAFSLSTERSADFLRWRYGPGAPANQQIILRDASGKMRGWYSFRVGHRGDRFGVRLGMLLDFLTDPTDTMAVRAAATDFIARGRLEKCHILEVRGMDPRLRTVFSHSGFRRRRLEANPFLCRANTKLHSFLPDSASWHLVAGDGDAGFA